MMIFGFTITEILALIGGITIVLNLIKILFDVIPKLTILKSQIYKSASGKIQHKRLEKLAIASNIESVVNQSVSFLRKELPYGWMQKAKIEWVQEEIQDTSNDEELILRIKPIKDQDSNLMNGILYYFSKTLFKGFGDVVPTIPKKAAILHLSRRAIRRNHPYAIEEFENTYLEKAVKKESEVAFYTDSYNSIDQYGYFTTVFIREMLELVERNRFKPERPNIPNDIRVILEHLLSFQKIKEKPDELWTNTIEEYTYAILLVARPYSRNYQPYLKRAESYLGNKVRKLYILGANDEKGFVKNVVKAINSKTDYKLLELFELNRDYRGEVGGICAVLVTS